MCDGCKVRNQAYQQMLLGRLPHVLVIHLKRFAWIDHFTNRKLDYLIDYPLRGPRATCEAPLRRVHRVWCACTRAVHACHRLSQASTFRPIAHRTLETPRVGSDMSSSLSVCMRGL